MIKIAIWSSITLLCRMFRDQKHVSRTSFQLTHLIYTDRARTRRRCSVIYHPLFVFISLLAPCMNNPSFLNLRRLVRALSSFFPREPIWPVLIWLLSLISLRLACTQMASGIR